MGGIRGAYWKVIPAASRPNPKSEGRNPKEGRIPNTEYRRPKPRSGISDFGFRPSFGPRISGFGFGPSRSRVGGTVQDARSGGRECYNPRRRRVAWICSPHAPDPAGKSPATSQQATQPRAQDPLPAQCPRRPNTHNLPWHEQNTWRPVSPVTRLFLAGG
jgi:hypothetical protein